jgi:hypothetical protein
VESMISIFEYKRRGREGVETGTWTFCCHNAREKATKRVGRSVDALKQNWPMRIQSCPKGERGDVCLKLRHLLRTARKRTGCISSNHNIEPG